MKVSWIKLVTLWMACLFVAANCGLGQEAGIKDDGANGIMVDSDGSYFDETELEAMVQEMDERELRGLLAVRNGEDGDPLERKLFFKKFRKKVKSGFKKIGGGIKSGFKTVGKGIKTGTKFVGKGIKTGAKAIGKGFKETGKFIKKTAVKLFDEFCEVLDDVVDKMTLLDQRIKIAEAQYKRQYAEYKKLEGELLQMEKVGRTPSRAWFLRLKNMRRGLDRSAATIRRLQKEVDDEPEFCEAIRKIAKTVSKAVEDAVREVKEFVEKHKCFLIETGFAIAGEIGDAALGVLSFGSLETQEANPICIGLAQGKFKKAFDHVTNAVDRGQTAIEAASEFSGKGGKGAEVITGIPVPATPGDMMVIMFEQVQQTACVLRREFDLDFDIIDAACERGDVATSFVTVLLNAFCGDFGSAVAEILKIAAQCAAGCSNGFCPNDHRLLIAISQGSSLRGA